MNGIVTIFIRLLMLLHNLELHTFASIIEHIFYELHSLFSYIELHIKLPSKDINMRD